jgi:hypothetical protein
MKSHRTLHHLFFLFSLTFPVLAGCATPEEKAQKEARGIEASQKKALADQEHWRQVLAPYTDEQLVVKVQELNDAVQRGTQGENLLLANNNLWGFNVAQGEVEKKVAERDAVAMELARRRSAPQEQGQGSSSANTNSLAHP